MFKVVAFGIGGREVKGLFGDKLWDIFVLLFGLCDGGFAGHYVLISGWLRIEQDFCEMVLRKAGLITTNYSLNGVVQSNERVGFLAANFRTRDLFINFAPFAHICCFQSIAMRPDSPCSLSFILPNLLWISSESDSTVSIITKQTPRNLTPSCLRAMELRDPNCRPAFLSLGSLEQRRQGRKCVHIYMARSPISMSIMKDPWLRRRVSERHPLYLKRC